MVLWIFPGCIFSQRCSMFFYPFWFFLLTFTDSITRTGTSGAGHHLSYHTVNTKYGALRGVKLQFSSSSVKHLDPVSAFLGIPYASPPINAYRFMPPVAPLPWGDQIRPATALPPACPQKFPNLENETLALQTMTSQRYNFLLKLKPHLVNQSEDCLYLNIYTPNNPSGEEIRPGKFAIVVVIHGESWEWGSGNEFDGGILASLGNHIVVTVNYRLGILGFLRTSSQQSNFGLLDVIAALHWIRENGYAFGGDRDRVTLMGYRSGAVIANLLLVAPIAKDLFQRAILISGSVLSPWALQRKPEDVALQVSKQMGCVRRLPLTHPDSDIAPCLRQKPLSELMSFVPETPRFLSPFAPYVDNNLVKNTKILMEKDPTEQFKRTDLIIIFTTSEGAHELNKNELTYGFEADHKDRILRTLVRNVFNFHQQEIFSIVKNEYTDWERPVPHPIPMRDATVEALSDCLVIGPAIDVAMIHAKKGGRTHLLHFSHVSREYDFSSYERLGSLEGDVVPYTMGLPVTNNVPALGNQQFLSPWSSLANFSKQDAVVSETLVQYLSNFAKSGDPNTNQVIREPSVGFVSSGSNDGSTNSNNQDWSSLSGSSSSLGSLSSSSLSSSSSSSSSNSSPSNSPSTSRERIRGRPLHWDVFEANSQYYMNIGTKPRVRSHYRVHKMALWLNLIPQIHLPGGSDVTIAHHSFPDDNPDLYVGPVRPLPPQSLSDQVGRGFDGGITYTGTNMQTGPTSPGTSMTTTECPEGTETPFPQGTRAMKNGNSNGNEVGMGLGISGEYDYATALTVTMTVGICLILLNAIVFAAIMCHRKRGIGLPGANHGNNLEPQNGIPLKSSYHQEDYKWESNMTEFPHHLSSYGNSGGDEMGETMGLSQFPAAACAQLDLKPVSMSNCNSLTRAGSIPYCVGGPVDPVDCIPMMPDSLMGSSIHVYLNQSAGKIQGYPSNPSALNLYRTYGNSKWNPEFQGEETAGLGLDGPKGKRGLGCSTGDSNTLPRSGGLQLQSSSVPQPTSNPGYSSPSGTGTLVGVLKRHSTTSTPNSTVKKRVQIQEISV